MPRSLLLFRFPVLLCVLWMGCRSGHDLPRPVEEALELAGSNAPELKQVIRHYRELDDTLKLEAAYFLIANMPGKYSRTHARHEQYLGFLSRLSYAPEEVPEGELTPGELLDSLRRALPVSFYNIEPDIQTISSETLIANIDFAFSEWETTPWKQDYTFEEFCEWVLPYRIHTERLENWREAALTQRFEREDSIPLLDSIILRMGVLLINNTGQRYDGLGASYPLPLSFTDMQILRKGACMELSDYATFLLRSRGVPASTELIPIWGNRSNLHAWNAIILPGGQCEGIGYDRRGYLQMDNKVPKVYRRRYALMPDNLLYRYRHNEFIPPFFEDCDLMDVTDQYNMPVSNVEITGLDPIESRIAWLCCFNNFDWTPVAYAEIKNGEAVFKNMGRGVPIRRHTEIGRGVMIGRDTEVPYTDIGEGIVYLPAYCTQEQIRPAANPVILQENGQVQVLRTDLNNRQTITLTRKYPQHHKFRDFLLNMTGGRFEGANRADFSDALVLHRITEPQPMPFTPYKVDNPGLFRYIRYVAPDSTYGNISEIRFFSEDAQLTGQPIGTPGIQPEHGPEAAFDRNILSWFQTRQAEHVWVGLDLGKPRPVTSLSYHARTDENEIYPGETYELRYWDNGWHVLGRKVAEDYHLQWEEVPSGTIYYIRNASKGVEQRIFTYENNKQVFW